MRNFMGTPVKAPQEISLAELGERTSTNKMRNFLGTPLNFLTCC